MSNKTRITKLFKHLMKNIIHLMKSIIEVSLSSDRGCLYSSYQLKEGVTVVNNYNLQLVFLKI